MDNQNIPAILGTTDVEREKNLQKTKKMSNTDPTKNNRWGEWGLSESRYSQRMSNFWFVYAHNAMKKAPEHKHTTIITYIVDN